jgi:hypothetical protein
MPGIAIQPEANINIRDIPPINKTQIAFPGRSVRNATTIASPIISVAHTHPKLNRNKPKKPIINTHANTDSAFDFFQPIVLETVFISFHIDIVYLFPTRSRFTNFLFMAKSSLPALEGGEYDSKDGEYDSMKVEYDFVLGESYFLRIWPF